MSRIDWDAVTLWAPVVFVGVVVQSAIGLEQRWSGSDLGLAVAALALALPLAVRRRVPVVTAALVAAAGVLQVAVGGSLGFGSFVSVLFATYAAGRWSPTWRGTVLAGLLVLGGVLVALADDVVDRPQELFFPVFYTAAASTVGRVVRTLSEQSAQLRRLNTTLAEQADLGARLAVETERNRISRELHDSIAHTLMVTVVQAEAAEGSLADDPDAARAALVRIQDTGRAGLTELRDTLRTLRSPGRGLTDLPALATTLEASGLAVALDVDAEPAQPLSGDLYRLAQEALTNVIKHSCAVTASVRVAKEDDAVVLTVADPGPAADGRRPPGGHGLAGMRERLASYGGRVAAGPDGAGWTVRAEVPL